MKKSDSNGKKSKEWKFKVVEVPDSESKLADFDIEEYLADMLVDCWFKFKPKNVEDFESSEALTDALVQNMRGKRRTDLEQEQVHQNGESEA